ncbi:MAG: DNA-directed RNA polymerase subunit delta [Anaeroplasma sp.]
MENISQMSLLEVAVSLMEQKRTVQNIYSLIKEVLEIKGLTDEDGSITTQLYVDITTSSKFVYMGNDEWNLKIRESLDWFDKDGSAFNSKDDEYIEDEDEDDESLDENDLDDEDDDNLDDEDEDEDDLDDEDDDDLDDEDDDNLDDSDDEDDDSDDKYDDEDFEEDKYNEYMDDYEDMYEN